MASLVDFPSELCIHIFSYLNLHDLLTCQLTHSSIHHVIAHSALLQYLIATQIAGVEDNPASKFSLNDRVDRLKSQEQAWSTFKFDFSEIIPISHAPEYYYRSYWGGLCCLGEETYLETDNTGRALRYFTLPSTPTQQVPWKKIDVGDHIISMISAIHEYDLLVVVTTCVLLTLFGFHLI